MPKATQENAALFALIAAHDSHHDRRVSTPKGSGALWQVFRDRAGVVLDAEPKRIAFFPAGEVQPAENGK